MTVEILVCITKIQHNYLINELAFISTQNTNQMIAGFAELVSELNKMPVKTDTLRMRNRKMELEKQLAKLEEGIKVFSRPKVFVKIGE